MSHVGALEAMENMGIDPDYVFGTSGGSIVASLFSRWSGAKMAKEVIYSMVQNHSWQRLSDIDLRGIRNIKHYNGIIFGNRIGDVLSNEGGLNNIKFSDLKKTLYFRCEL